MQIIYDLINCHLNFKIITFFLIPNDGLLRHMFYIFKVQVNKCQILTPTKKDTII